MEIRLFRESDNREAVSRLYAESWRSVYRGLLPAEFLDFIPVASSAGRLAGRPDRITLLALEEDTVCGLLAYGASRSPEFKGESEIYSLYVLPDRFHEGIGSELLSEALRRLRASGVRCVYLWVLEENERARGFYEYHGFFRTPVVREDRIAGNTLRELRYILTLT